MPPFFDRREEEVEMIGDVERVTAGGGWLDHCAPPQWFFMVDLKILDMANPFECVLGQVFGINHEGAPGYVYAKRFMGDNPCMPMLLGFTASSPDWHAGIAQLENVWRDYIMARRAAWSPAE